MAIALEPRNFDEIIYLRVLKADIGKRSKVVSPTSFVIEYTISATLQQSSET